MIKKYLLVAITLVLIIAGYAYVIENKHEQLYAEDRSILVKDYQGKNYYGIYSVASDYIRFVEIDSNIEMSDGKKVGNHKDIESFKITFEKDYQTKIDDYFEFDNEKLVDDNLTADTKIYYQQLWQNHNDVIDILNGNLKYHPKYNKPLVRIAKIITGGSSKVMEDDSLTSEEITKNKATMANGEMSKKKVKEMQDLNIPNTEINRGFYSVRQPIVTCEKDTCKYVESSITQITNEINKDTRHKINVEYYLK